MVSSTLLTPPHIPPFTQTHTHTFTTSWLLMGVCGGGQSSGVNGKLIKGESGVSVCDFGARWEGALVKVERIAGARVQVFSRTVLQESFDLRAYLHTPLHMHIHVRLSVCLWICIHLTHTLSHIHTNFFFFNQKKDTDIMTLRPCPHSSHT